MDFQTEFTNMMVAWGNWMRHNIVEIVCRGSHCSRVAQGRRYEFGTGSFI